MTNEERDNWLFTNFPIGHRFWYLGRELIVEWQSKLRWESTYHSEQPFISCHYADNNGEIRTIKFYSTQVELLMSL